MKFLITGCNGYLGSKLCHHLLAEGHTVYGVDNLMYGTGPIFSLASYPNFKFVKCDVIDVGKYIVYIEAADTIIPLAALVGAPLCDSRPTEAYNTNVKAIQKLVSNLRPNQKIIYPTTNSGYGLGIKNKSGEAIHCTEETPLRPISLYGETKCEAEQAVLAVNGISLRLATVCGMSPRPRLDLLVNNWTYEAMNTGQLDIYQPEAMRNYVHINDVVRAFHYCAMNYEAMSGNVYNLGDDAANCSKWQLAEKIKSLVPCIKLDIMEGSDPDQRNYIVSSQKLYETGFKINHSIEEAIEEIIKNYYLLQSVSTILRNY